MNKSQNENATQNNSSLKSRKNRRLALNTLQSPLYGFLIKALAIILLICGAGFFIFQEKTVNLKIDGSVSHFRTTATSVQKVLEQRGIAITGSDILIPDFDSKITDNIDITIQHTKQISLLINGKPTEFYSTDSTLGKALDNFGIASAIPGTIKEPYNANTSIYSINTPVEISTSRKVEVIVDKQIQQAYTKALTVSSMLQEMGISVSADDKLSKGLNSLVDANMVLKIERAKKTVQYSIKSVPFKVVEKKDSSLYKGQKEIKIQGKMGQEKTITQKITGGKTGKGNTKTNVAGSVIIKPPVDQVVAIGTKEEPQVPDVSANVSPGTAQSIAKDMLTSKGLGDDQFKCLRALWNRESGWNVNSHNSSSGAHGIPQALPGNKMASAGSDWRTNPATQIKWGLGYIKGRYGTPCGAWSHFQSKNWY